MSLFVKAPVAGDAFDGAAPVTPRDLTPSLNVDFGVRNNPDVINGNSYTTAILAGRQIQAEALLTNALAHSPVEIGYTELKEGDGHPEFGMNR